MADPRLGQAIQHSPHHAPGQKAAAGDHQHVIDALFPKKLPQPPHGPRAFQCLGRPVIQKVIAQLQHSLNAAAV